MRLAKRRLANLNPCLSPLSSVLHRVVPKLCLGMPPREALLRPLNPLRNLRSPLRRRPAKNPVVPKRRLGMRLAKRRLANLNPCLSPLSSALFPPPPIKNSKTPSPPPLFLL